MKFWELTSVVRDERQILEAGLSKPEWNQYYDWYLNLDHLCRVQDREKLDAIIPVQLARDVLSSSKRLFYLNASQLRASRFTKDDLELSALETFEKFGGKAMEEAREFGSFKID
jgi:hypothetical protein